MSLIDVFKDKCEMMERTRVSDGEGGWSTEWTYGDKFDAAIVMDTTVQARIAEHEGMTSKYTVTTHRDTSLGFHDAFRRISDGKVFRVTSDPTDKQTPSVASFQFSQVTAEEWQPA